MNRRCLLAATAALFCASAHATTVGQNAPAFSLTDVNGKTVQLSDFRGKHVVLEWVNPGCPFVVKHYASGNMAATQKAAADAGIAWLTINSTARDHRDYQAPAALGAWMNQHKAVPTATLMDVDGKVGRAFGARVTPHMYLIDPAGKLIYAGAIDSKATANPADIAGATNYVKQAMAEAKAGKPISVASTNAYGCTIKYANPG